jgi:hypothetical protein
MIFHQENSGVKVSTFQGLPENRILPFPNFSTCQADCPRDYCPPPLALPLSLVLNLCFHSHFHVKPLAERCQADMVAGKRSE